MLLLNAHLQSLNKIKLFAQDIEEKEINSIQIYNNRSINIIYYTIYKEYVELILEENINIKCLGNILYKDQNKEILCRDYYKTSEFNDKYYYSGLLGSTYSKEATTFKLFSPPASYVNLLLYSYDQGDNLIKKTNMTESNGIFTCTIYGDLKDFFYLYEICVYDNVNQVNDPYAKAISINYNRSAIIDFKKTNPNSLLKNTVAQNTSTLDSIIYELNIRDISINENSNSINKGKFLALTEDTYSLKGYPTVLNHIKDLGVTHIQLMPVFHYSSKKVDEKIPFEKYNWGYDIDSYFALSGVYSNDPYNPSSRIIEFKTLVNHLHENGLKVNLDVVYNHIFYAPDSDFQKIFPGYYYRIDNNGKLENASNCSCDLACENKMVEKLILDSLEFMVEEYDVDGFRFDLMGLHNINLMKNIIKLFKNYNKEIMLYGEGWDLNNSVPHSLRPIQINAEKMKKFGFFNDTFRDAIKGSVFFEEDKGFISGKPYVEEAIKKSILGSNFKYQNPNQSINYFSCHDNHTIWDKLEISNNSDDINTKKDMAKLAFSIMMFSQGIPFIHSGSEFCRTKFGIIDSYMSLDRINSIDWDRKEDFMDVYNYCKGLIAFRKQHTAFRMNNFKDINEHIEFLNSPLNSVVYHIKNNANNDVFKNLIIIFNANKYSEEISIPFNSYNIALDKYKNISNTTSFNGDKIKVEGLSTTILYNE
ncbi:MAG: type I pullulanase [Clostridiaceae bacterium]